MESHKYRFLLWQFIAALDTGKYDSLGIEAVKRHAEAGTIPAFLVDRFGSDLDLSVFTPQDWTTLSDTWASIHNAVDARRKFGVENMGISLLMAYTLESMQMLDSQQRKSRYV